MEDAAVNARWEWQDARNQLSEVVEKACADGPQTITRHGVPTVVVLSVPEYRRLTRGASSLVDFLRESPLAGVELELRRAQDGTREVEL
jgi:prevent-host-death family protein